MQGIGREENKMVKKESGVKKWLLKEERYEEVKRQGEKHDKVLARV